MSTHSPFLASVPASDLAAQPLASFASPLLIRRAAVLGAGTMGSRIAAHLANAGIPTLLLDLVPAGEGDRSRLAKAALDALAKAKPAAFYEPSLAALITPGNFDDDLPKLASCDWVIEAVAENLAIKTALLDARRAASCAACPAHHQHLRPADRADRRGPAATALTATASSERISSIRRATCGCWRSFPPPRPIRAVVAAFAAFADRNLGKQVVFANDTPNFIANRIGIAVMFTAAALMLEQGLTIEEVDALTGQAIGWPRTGTFRLADMVGIDILAHVAANFPQGVTQSGFSGDS